MARQLVADFSAKDGTELTSNENSITVKIDIPGTGRRASLFYLDSKGRLNVWPGTIGDQIGKAGLNPSLASEYGDRMKVILGLPKGRRDLTRSITDVDLNAFKSAVDEFIQSILLAKPIEEP